MTDIVAGDVSARILRRSMVNPASSEAEAGQPWVNAVVDIVIDISTNADVPSGGIPLTNLFTASNANDTGLDPAQPIYTSGLVSMVSDATETTRLPCEFLQSGATAATQVLAVYEITDSAGVSQPLTPTTGDLTTDDYLGSTTPTEATCRVTLTGRLRSDVDVTTI